MPLPDDLVAEIEALPKPARIAIDGYGCGNLLELLFCAERNVEVQMITSVGYLVNPAW